MELGVPSAATSTCARSTASSRSPPRRAPRPLHTSPIALRFVAASDACASMMHGTPTMMIELILVSGTRGGNELLQEYERALAEFGARRTGASTTRSAATAGWSACTPSGASGWSASAA